MNTTHTVWMKRRCDNASACMCIHTWPQRSLTLRVYSFSSKKHYYTKKRVMCSDSSTPLVRIQSPWIATTHTSLNARAKETNRDRDGGKRGKIKNALINRKGEVMQKTNRKVIFPSLHIYLCVNAVSCGHPPTRNQTHTHTHTQPNTHRQRARVRGPAGPELIKGKMNISCSIILS